ncbi:MAG: DNA-directed RNA polymerase subunit omega [Phycisphaerales bacterium]
MIEALKSEKIVEQVGGRFKLCALIQKRLVELMEGARPLVERDGRRDLELVVEEIVQGKIAIEDVDGTLNPGGIAPEIDEATLRELEEAQMGSRAPASESLL